MLLVQQSCKVRPLLITVLVDSQPVDWPSASANHSERTSKEGPASPLSPSDEHSGGERGVPRAVVEHCSGCTESSVPQLNPSRVGASYSPVIIPRK